MPNGTDNSDAVSHIVPMMINANRVLILGLRGYMITCCLSKAMLVSVNVKAYTDIV
jgi:hypothetical protein